MNLWSSVRAVLFIQPQITNLQFWIILRRHCYETTIWSVAFSTQCWLNSFNSVSLCLFQLNALFCLSTLTDSRLYLCSIAVADFAMFWVKVLKQGPSTLRCGPDKSQAIEFSVDLSYSVQSLQWLPEYNLTVNNKTKTLFKKREK